jgi:hypothetical protein
VTGQPRVHDEVAVEVDGTWSIGDKPHGGYLLALMAEAALDADHPHPMAVSAHYVAPPAESAAVVEIARLRTGRRVASSRLRLVQDGEPKVEVLLSSGRWSEAPEPHWTAEGSGPPELPPVEDCPRAPSTKPGGTRVGQLDHVDMRPDPSTVMWAVGQPAGRAEIRAWLRRDDGADASMLDLLVFADALPPVTFDLGLLGWVPTLELTVILRGLPAPGWVRAVQRATLLQDGWLDEECELWDSRGRLVAQARQLAGYRTV